MFDFSDLFYIIIESFWKTFTENTKFMD